MIDAVQEDITELDYAILVCLKDADTPLWKTALHKQLQQVSDSLPGDTDTSVPTVGRHVDWLHEQAYISSTISKPADLDRELIIAYQVTDAGKAALQQKRTALLKQYASSDIGPDEITVSKPALLHLLEEELQFDDDMRTLLEEDCDLQEVLLVAKIHYLKQFINEHVSEEAFQRLLETADYDLNPLLRSLF